MLNFFGNFGNLFSHETIKTLRTSAVSTLNLPVKSHASKQSDALPPREYLTLNVNDKAKPTVPSVCKPCFKNVGDFIKHVDSLKLSSWTSGLTIKVQLLPCDKFYFILITLQWQIQTFR